MSRPLLIGQAPGPSSDPAMPLYPLPRRSAGGRLLALTGLSLGQYLRAFDRMNLLPYFPGSSERQKGDLFPMREAKLAAATVRPLLDGRVVVCMGRGVMTAFGLDEADPLVWHVMDCGHGPAYPRRRARVAWLPHTSGCNRWYNNAANVARARQFLSGLLTYEALPFADDRGSHSAGRGDPAVSPSDQPRERRTAGCQPQTSHN